MAPIIKLQTNIDINVPNALSISNLLENMVYNHTASNNWLKPNISDYTLKRLYNNHSNVKLALNKEGKYSTNVAAVHDDLFYKRKHTE